MGLDVVRGRLAPAEGEPTLYYAKALAETQNPRGILRAKATYAYPEAKDGRRLSDIPKKDGITDHANDAERYLCVMARLDAGGTAPTQVGRL